MFLFSVCCPSFTISMLFFLLSVQLQPNQKLAHPCDVVRYLVNAQARQHNTHTPVQPSCLAWARCKRQIPSQNVGAPAVGRAKPKRAHTSLIALARHTIFLAPFFSFTLLMHLANKWDRRGVGGNTYPYSSHFLFVDR